MTLHLITPWDAGTPATFLKNRFMPTFGCELDAHLCILYCYKRTPTSKDYLSLFANLETFLLCFYFWQTSTLSYVISLPAVSRSQDKVLEMQKVIFFHSSPYMSQVPIKIKEYPWFFGKQQLPCPPPPFASSPVHALLLKVITRRFKGIVGNETGGGIRIVANVRYLVLEHGDRYLFTFWTSSFWVQIQCPCLFVVTKWIGDFFDNRLCTANLCASIYLRVINMIDLFFLQITVIHASKPPA